MSSVDMWAPSCLLTEEQLLCSICLEVFTSPVTLPCGHNFCKKCITKHWDTNNQCQCPTCKESFKKRPYLRVNVFISEMAAHFQASTGMDKEAAKPGEIPCDICTEPKTKAVKSCLVCLVSYCETHLKPHMTPSQLKKHQLIDPVENLEARMCKVHDKPLELFCETDQTCVCMLCSILDHKKHKVIPMKEQYTKKTTELRKTEIKINRMILQRRLKINNITHLAKLSKESSDREMANGVVILTSLIQSLEQAQAEFIEMIEEKQTAIEHQAKSFIQDLDLEISGLMRRRADVEQLSRSKDPIYVVQGLSSLNTALPTKDWTKVNIDTYDVTVKETVDQLEDMLKKETKKLLRKVKLNRIQQSEVDVTLDPDTAHVALILSDDGKQVHHSSVKKILTDSPERFNPSCCVLGKQSFSSGKFYFEVDVKEKTRWTLGVARKSIKRKGILPLCPDNGHWTLWLKNGDEYSALVGSPKALSLDSKPQKLGVFVDYEERLVSFYDVDTADVIYSFTRCKFKEELFPFFSPGLSDGGNSAPMVITPANHTVT